MRVSRCFAPVKQSPHPHPLKTRNPSGTWTRICFTPWRPINLECCLVCLWSCCVLRVFPPSWACWTPEPHALHTIRNLIVWPSHLIHLNVTQLLSTEIDQPRMMTGLQPEQREARRKGNGMNATQHSASEMTRPKSRFVTLWKNARELAIVPRKCHV